DLAFPPADRPLCDNERLYESWSNTTILCQTAKLAEPSVPVWVAMLGVLRPRGIGLDADTVAVGTFPRATHAAKDLPNTAAVGELPGVVRTGIGQPTLAIARAAERDMMVIRSKLWCLPLVPRSPWWWWILAALLLAAGAVWVWMALSRLFLFDFHE